MNHIDSQNYDKKKDGNAVQVTMEMQVDILAAEKERGDKNQEAALWKKHFAMRKNTFSNLEKINFAIWTKFGKMRSAIWTNTFCKRLCTCILPEGP